MAFLDTLTKFCKNQNVGNLWTKNNVNGCFFKFCQLFIYSSHSRISPLLKENRKKKLKQGCGRWETFIENMVHRIIATIAVNLV